MTDFEKADPSVRLPAAGRLGMTSARVFNRLSGDLLPEGAVAGSEKRIFAGVPAEKMWRMHVFGVRLAAGPDFMEQIAAGLLHRGVQIKREAALFLSVPAPANMLS